MSSPRIGLALGAGGARGLAHVGVLRGLAKHHIQVDMITGSSIGALVGAMYAARQDIDWMITRFREMLDSEAFAQSGINWVKAKMPGTEPGFLQWAAEYVASKLVLNLSESRSGVVKNTRLLKLIDYLLPVKDFSELRLPFACCAVDLQTGEDVILTQGDLVQAVAASSCIPGYLMPIEVDDRLLVDGGVSRPVPGNLARQMGADFVIAVDIATQRFHPLEQNNIVSILGRTSEISATRLAQVQRNSWDFLLRPETGDTHWTEFEHLDKLVAAGEEVVEHDIRDLRRNIAALTGVRGWLAKKVRRFKLYAGS